MEAIRSYIDTLFMDIPVSQERNQLKKQIIDHAQATYNELKEVGLPEGEIARTVITGLDSQTEIVRKLGLPVGILDGADYSQDPVELQPVKPENPSPISKKDTERPDLSMYTDEELALPFDETFSGGYWLSATGIFMLSFFSNFSLGMITPVYWIAATGVFLITRGVLLRRYGIPKSEIKKRKKE